MVAGLHGDGGEEVVDELVLAGFFAAVCGFEVAAEACEYVQGCEDGKIFAGAHRVGNGPLCTDAFVNGVGEVLEGGPGFLLLFGKVVGGARGGVERQDDEVVGRRLGQGCCGVGGLFRHRAAGGFPAGGTALLFGPAFGVVEVCGLLFGGVLVGKKQVAEVEGEVGSAFVRQRAGTVAAGGAECDSLVGLGQVGDEVRGSFVATVPSVQDEVTPVGFATAEGEVVVGGVGAGVEEVGYVADELGVG